MSERKNQSGKGSRDRLSAAESSRPSQLWWVYFGLLVILGVAGAAPYLSLIRERRLSGPGLALPAIATLLNLWALVGLGAYIRSRRLAWSGFWQLCLGLTVIQWIFSASMFLRSLPLDITSPEGRVSMLGLLGLALWLPLLVALWRYTFLSPKLWQA
jgi:hypothetical protein